MPEIQPAQLALPAPRMVGPTGLRASLRGASALPIRAVDPIDAAKAPGDAAFGTTVQRVAAAEQQTDEAGQEFARQTARFGADQQNLMQAGGQFGPFLAQQLGQHSRLVMPTLAASAEVEAYAAAQARTESSVRTSRTLLDIQA